MTTSQSLDVHIFLLTSLLNGNLSGKMTQGRREMMAGQWRDTLGRVENGVDPGRGYRNILSYFGTLMIEFPLTYCDELIGEVSVWGGNGGRDSLTTTFYTGGTILLHSFPHGQCIARSLCCDASPNCQHVLFSPRYQCRCSGLSGKDMTC